MKEVRDKQQMVEQKRWMINLYDISRVIAKWKRDQLICCYCCCSSYCHCCCCDSFFLYIQLFMHTVNVKIEMNLLKIFNIHFTTLNCMLLFMRTVIISWKIDCSQKESKINMQEKPLSKVSMYGCILWNQMCNVWNVPPFLTYLVDFRRKKMYDARLSCV